MGERPNGGGFMESDDWYQQHNVEVPGSTSRLRKKRFLGTGSNHRSNDSVACSKAYLTNNSNGGEISRGNKENRSDALNRLLARKKRNKLSSLYYSSDEDEGDEFPVASRRLSASLLQDSSGSELDDSPGTEKSNESDVFGADDEFCMLSIEPKHQYQVKFNGRTSGFLPGGGKEMFTMKSGKSNGKQSLGHNGQFPEKCDSDQKQNNHVGFSAVDSTQLMNSDLNDSELPDLDVVQNSYQGNGRLAKKKKIPDHANGICPKTSPSHTLPGNFYKKKFPHMFTNNAKKPGSDQPKAAARLSLLSSSSSDSDSDPNSFMLNDEDKMCSETENDQSDSPVFGISKSDFLDGKETKKRKYSSESCDTFLKKLKSNQGNHETDKKEISPIFSKRSSPFLFTDSPVFPSTKSNGLRRLSFEGEKCTTSKTAAVGHCSSDSDSDSFWKAAPSKNIAARSKMQVSENKSSQRSKLSSVFPSGKSPPAFSRGRIAELKDHDPVRLSVSPKSRHTVSDSVIVDQSLEEGMHFTDETLRKQLNDLFGNDSDEELEWQPTIKKTKMTDDERKSKRTKGNKYCVKKASGNKIPTSTSINMHANVHEKKVQAKPRDMSFDKSDSDDSDWEKKLLKLVEDISSSSRRSKTGLTLLNKCETKEASASNTGGKKSCSPRPSFARSSPTSSASSAKPRNSSVSSFPGPNTSGRSYYDNQGLIRPDVVELPTSVTLSSPPKLIKSISTPKAKRRCRRSFSNGSVIYIEDTESESSDNDVIPLIPNKKPLHLSNRTTPNRDPGHVISPRIRQLQEDDARSEFDAMLDPVLLRELETELTPAKPKKAIKNRKTRGTANEPVEMVVEVTLDESIQREIQAGIRMRDSHVKDNSASRSRHHPSVSDNSNQARPQSGSSKARNDHTGNSQGGPSHFSFGAGMAGQVFQSHLQNDLSPPPFMARSPVGVKTSPRGRGKKGGKVNKRSSLTSPGSTPSFSPPASDAIQFVPTSPALQASPRTKNRRSRQKTSRGSVNRPFVIDPVTVVQQIDDDEALAKQMQEQMDLEFAQALMREEESAVAASQLAAQQSPAMPFPHHHLPASYISAPPLQMPIPRVFNPPPTSQFNPYNVPQNAVRKSPTSRGRRRQTRAQIADQVALNQMPNFESQAPVDTAMYLHVAMGMGMLEQGRPPSISPRGHRRGRGRRRGAVAAANAVQADDYEALLALGEIIGDARPKGLTKSSIDQLPTKVYKKTTTSSKDDECSVCMADYEDGENLRILPCFHNFHVKCIDKWIKDNATCPICRVPVKLS